MTPLGIYVHLPFCAVKCPYCDFYSGPFRKGAAEAYAEAVCQEMRLYAGKHLQADTLYFGGGTPSLLEPALLGKILRTARACLGLLPSAEISMEANPNTVTPARLKGYLQEGVNRISFGVQSGNARELMALGRRHTAAQAEQAVCWAKKVGFPSISIDLMLGIPEQTKASLEDSLALAERLPLDHLSVYLLKVEESTPLAGSPLLERCAGEDELAEMYLHMAERLEGLGYFQYEISNFARPGQESRHNLKYWEAASYLGFGAAAHSFWEGKRFANPPDLAAYTAHPGEGRLMLEERVCAAEEYLLLGLRLTKGVSFSRLAELGGDPELLRRRAARFCDAGLAEEQDEGLRLTREGFLVSNLILGELLYSQIT